MKKVFNQFNHCLVDSQKNTIGICLSTEEYQDIMSKLEDYADARDAEETFKELAQRRSLAQVIDDTLAKKA